MKTMKFYREMPNLFFDATQQLTRLIYFEGLNTEQAAMQRFKLISRFTRVQKEKIIRSVNPNWVDLSIGLDLEKVLYKRMEQSMAINYQG